MDRGYTTAFRQGIKPPPVYTISEWADKHRILPPRASSEPGPFRTSRNPPMKAVMDSLTPNNGINKVVLMKPTQWGGTEIGNNWIGSTIDHYPVPMMMVLPTVELAKRSSKQRINPMIEATPRLREAVTDNKSRDNGNTILGKDFPGGTLIMTGANSAVGLRSMPCCNLMLDEVDGYGNDVDGEGDPIEIAEKRTDTYARKKKILYISTPTTDADSKIKRLYEKTDMRKCYLPCPHCHYYQVLLWGGIKWEGQGVNLKVWYECEGCREQILEHHKTWMLDHHEWRSTAEPEESNVIGFWINGLYSPLGWFSWHDAVIKFFKAKAAADRKDFTKLKTFTNTVLAETWDENAGEQIDHSILFTRRAAYPEGIQVPNAGFILTCGVDVQADRLELETVAWGDGEESFGVERKVLDGDPTLIDVWDELDVYLFNSKFLHESGNYLRILATCIDSGYLAKMVYAFVKTRQHKRVYATKGMSGEGRPIVSEPARKQKGVAAKRKVNLYTIGTDEAKLITHRRLGYTIPGPGYAHYPTTSDYTEEYFEQLTGEKRVKRFKKGFTFYEWQKTRPRNEALDIRVLNLAALQILNPNWSAIQSQLTVQTQINKENELVESNGRPPIVRPAAPKRKVRHKGLN